MRCVVDVDDRYSVTADGLRVLGVTATDEGDYTCRAEVEADGRYDERRIHVEVHGKLTVDCYQSYVSTHARKNSWQVDF